MTNPRSLLPIAMEATARAADLMRSRLPAELTAKGDRDYASDVDYDIERQLRAYLAEVTPEIGFLGEEEGPTGGQRLHWALDPIDGTVNFANALPLCAVSLALIQEDQATLGVIQLPLLQHIYTAVQGDGAKRDGRPIVIGSPGRLREAIVTIGDYAVGVGADIKNLDRLAVTGRLAGEALRIRMLGSAAIDLAWLAEGLTGAAIMLGNKPWDTSAGVIVAKEAGAIVVDIDGSPHTTHSKFTIAAAPTIASEVLDLVRTAINDE